MRSLYNWQNINTIIYVVYIRFHDRRHTFATLALKNGATIKDVQEALGHYSAGFTLDTYVHAAGNVQRETANRMEKVLEGVLPGAGRGR